MAAVAKRTYGLREHRPPVGWTAVRRSDRISVEWPLQSLVNLPRKASLSCLASSPKLNAEPDSRPSSRQPAKLWGKTGSKLLQPSPSSSSHSSRTPNGNAGGEDEGEESTWGVFNASRYTGSWQVPWGPGRVAGGLALWFGSFIGVGFVLVPQLYRMAGVSLYDLSPEDKATFTLVCQAVETVVSLALVRLITVGPITEAAASSSSSSLSPSSSSRPPPLSPANGLDFFVYDPRRPFSRPRGWGFWALLGVVASPAVVGSVAALLSVVGYEQAVGGQGTVDGVAGMIDLDLPTYLSLLAVTGVMAPLLEETVFRGFLLTSLTRFMPTWAAVAASSVSFGLAHLSARDLPVLCALGLLLGWSYVRSRNLLTPIVIHGAWNSAVLTLLFWLAAEGVDVQQLISDLRDASG
ncbi:hypothetical protein VOLCADRAFT_120396 [Volvox carteri f. nagariensis]|uniref:CAAX prenyl protease 2/Lysostaphin resistance protein A-like domain-containing protein n=1 Tax=Volvox carteri f. nagariensis TaxID=3068 RepID=D8TKB2_VOLCA|nr:uncharacterized protein VOLCADRAFT_120396 [Volvox carteri f. nagariensis]EFJ52218.1 hypothetical protein VOLCADRAFT_120396 [Volvox carteri f. nagariensis]|eukprot:XP_002946992.1 hypothetical protein VOLCADRAFT_120396 [Volvox carteri f. nagariensis]